MLARWAAALLIVSLCAPACRPASGMLTDDLHDVLVGAARTGDIPTIARLAAEGLDLDQPQGRNRWTALQHAVHTQQAAAVRVLLEWGATPDATQPGNPTALFMAADSADPAIVRLLLDAGADPAYVGAGGRTPLTQAISGGALWDVMDRPVFGGCHAETVRTLIDAHAPKTPETKAWNQAIWWARVHDCEPVLELAGTWTSHTTADKIVTAAGVVKDALGVKSPKDVLEQRRATRAPSRP